MKEIDSNYFGLNGDEATPRKIVQCLSELLPSNVTQDAIECIASYIGDCVEDRNEIRHGNVFVDGYECLTATLLTTLRFYPSVPTLPRFAVKDTDF